MRKRTVVLAMLALSAALALGGCGGGDDDSAGDGASSTPSETSTATDSASATASGSAGSGSSDGSGDASHTASVDPDAPADQCDDNVLAVDVAPQEGGGSAGNYAYSVTFTNSGDDSCELKGFPGVSVVGDENGTQLGQPADRTDADTPTLTIEPGASVSATLQVTDVGALDCDPSEGDGWRVYPPHSFEAFYVPDAGVQACSDDQVFLTVGPVEQS